MVQRIRSFEEGVRKGLGIVIRCEGCGREVVYRCWDFMGFIAPMSDIEELRWRCGWCGTRRVWVRYTLIDGVGREAREMDAAGRIEETMVKTSRKDSTATLDKATGTAVRTRRLQLGITQAELGEAIGVSYQQIQKYETGDNRISVSSLIGLAKRLGTTAAEIVAEIEEAK